MGAGLQVFDDNGLLVWDTADFITRSLGSAQIGYGTGTIIDDRFTLGIGWAIPLMEGDKGINTVDPTYGHVATNLWATAPSVSFSGNRLVWTRPANPLPLYMGNIICTLYYGVH